MRPTKSSTLPGKAVQQPASPSLKAAVKSEAKPVGKTKPTLTIPAKASATAAVKAAKKDVAPAVVSASAAPAPPVAPRAVPSPIPMSSLKPPPPLKPGRRSSARTAAQSPPPAPMVPTHAPDAAKASYSTMTERVIAPLPQAAAKKDPKLANNWKTKSAQELSDEEVKSMPDSEYMNEKQLAFFRHKLSLLKQDIHNSAGATTEHLREDTVVVPDPADRATIEEEHALELRTRDRERKLLKKIEQSIGRIDSGDYGYCDETGEAIGVGRLIARPTANLSLEAQQRRELKQKMFGD
ncbi:MAG: RNA polymerase-binding protein DksA [Polaromonas sp.]|nr:RNA polymerase-binding protein DksA [Polaromonas sp.]